MRIFIAILLALILGFGVITLISYNTFALLDEDVKAKWLQVQNNYKRRADLTPNLVNVVKGYASHEKDTFLAVTEARSKVSQVSVKNPSDTSELEAFSKVQDNLSSALSSLMVVVERYPELKADKNFLALQSQLEGSEKSYSSRQKRLYRIC